MVSTISSAGWPAASIARRTSAISVMQPVEVSLCTTHTALISRALSSFSRASILAGSAPLRQSDAMRSGTGVGPGICRKWRPALREEFWDMEKPGLVIQHCVPTIRYRDVANEYAIFGSMTKLLEQAIEKIREMPEADQDLAADFLFA